ncbi:uncharacterized protein LOC135403957 [Pseudopipra pipra]|uniref:uncharacterized protein LOC135403957 n=3 Tax=Pipridae TaxID=114313 RepID=UPI00313974B6
MELCRAGGQKIPLALPSVNCERLRDAKQCPSVPGSCQCCPKHPNPSQLFWSPAEGEIPAAKCPGGRKGQQAGAVGCAGVAAGGMLTQGGAGAAQPWWHQQQGVSPVPIGPAGAEHCWGCYKRPGRARLCQAALATLSSGNRSSSASLADMSCYELCPPKASVAVPKPSVAVPQPIAESCNELCARQCPDSTAFIQPPPVVVTFPGPILSSFPQQAVVGSAGAPAFGGSLGLGGLYGQGATQASGGLCTFPTACAAPACSPWLLPRYSRKIWDTCGPC